MPTKKEIFSHVKSLEIQKTSKEGLNAEKMWSGEENGVEFRVARVTSIFDRINSFAITGEANPTCIAVGIKGESEEESRKMRGEFVSALGKPLQLKAKDSSENSAPKLQETIVWIEKEALANEGRKPHVRISSLLNK